MKAEFSRDGGRFTRRRIEGKRSLPVTLLASLAGLHLAVSVRAEQNLAPASRDSGSFPSVIESTTSPCAVDSSQPFQIKSDSTDHPAVAEANTTRAPSSRPVKTVHKEKSGIQWGSLIRQEFMFFAVENGFRLATQVKTRRELGGPFFADWAAIIANTQWSRWDDGDRWVTSNVFHPAQGSISAWIYRQNDTNVRNLEQDFHDPAYRQMLVKAFGVATVAAFLWKIGPVSEATIGHVGLHPTVNMYGIPIREGNRTGLNDYVMNETGGVLLMIGEDWLDKHVARLVERHIQSRTLVATVRLLTSPTRSVANVIGYRKPWYREGRDSLVTKHQ